MIHFGLQDSVTSVLAHMVFFHLPSPHPPSSSSLFSSFLLSALFFLLLFLFFSSAAAVTWGETGTEISQQRKLTRRRKFPRRSCRDSNPGPFEFDHESGVNRTPGFLSFFSFLFSPPFPPLLLLLFLVFLLHCSSSSFLILHFCLFSAFCLLVGSTPHPSYFPLQCTSFLFFLYHFLLIPPFSSHCSSFLFFLFFLFVPAFPPLHIVLLH